MRKKIKSLGPDFEDLANEYHGVNEYPLRSKEEDQRWAVNTVGCWLAALAFFLLGIFAFLILGAIYA